MSDIERCPRGSAWCDGEICRNLGIDCPNAEPKPDASQGEMKAAPYPNCAGAVEALREVVRLRSLDGKDAGVKADLMAQAAQEALWKLDPSTTGGQ